jgi:hypothetical protein
MAKELDTNTDGYIDTDLLGSGTPGSDTYLRGDSSWSTWYQYSVDAPVDTTLIWFQDIS